MSKEEVLHKLEVLRKRLFIKGVSLNWNDYELSELETVVILIVGASFLSLKNGTKPLLKQAF